MKNVILIALAILLVTSCSKDRRVIRKLDGTWNVDSANVHYIHYIAKKYGSTTYYLLDTTGTYMFANVGYLVFDKTHTANNDFRLGNIQFNIPKIKTIPDTVVNRPFNDVEKFDFFIDQIYSGK